ncbi:MAG: G1 family endopeptidase [Thermoplasmata archaeon]|nr:G1 family endopeptidase [Thermoplasmata archaeon]
MSRSISHARVAAVAIGALMLASAGLVGVSVGATATHLLTPTHGLRHGSSTNWAGFAVTGPSKSVTDVKGSWIVPSIHGSCPSATQYSSFWVGIDGYGSNSVEQTGTDSDCQGGSAVYYAWYEFYPHPSHQITTLTISSGDTIRAEVHFASGKFTATIKDVTTGKSFSTSARVAAQRTSAEWIAEAPSLCTITSCTVQPLADFGTVDFGTDYTSVPSTNNATVSGTNGTMGSFAHLHSIAMVNNAGTKNKATPSAVSSDKTSFTVTWVSAGP